MKRFLIPLILLATSCHQPHITPNYQAIAFTQNELIIAYQEKTEELAMIIHTTLPAYRIDYTAIDSLNATLDTLYLTH